MTFDPAAHLMDMKGKKYLPVAPRVAWFRDAYPQGTISTDILQTEPFMLVKATIAVDGVVIATGHGTATASGGKVWSGREIEKAETAAIGRALAHAGFGTLFALEDGDDEGEHLAESPAAPRRNPTPTPKPAAKPEKNSQQSAANDDEQFNSMFGPGSPLDKEPIDRTPPATLPELWKRARALHMPDPHTSNILKKHAGDLAESWSHICDSVERARNSKQAG